ncbi:hypothetical protein ACP6JE_000546 [Aspergillus fumigatus]
MLPSEPKAFDAGQPDHSGQALYEWLWQSPSPTLELAQSRCFKSPASFLTLEERTRLTYERAKKICDVYGMLVRADSKDRLRAQFMLTEVGHGLDARNLKTTATLLPDGSFELHSPSWAAAKLVISHPSKHHAKWMARTMGALPPRAGAHPVDHALTLFKRVVLPNSALLGSLEKPRNERDHFFATIHRVSAGTVFLSGASLPALQLAVYNAAQFSLRRRVTGHDGNPMAVIKFRTQHLPILHAIAQYRVLQAFLVEAATTFRNRKVDPRVRHAIATVFKAVALQHFQKSIKALNDECGWHGYCGHNQILQLELEFRAVGTAEGDIRVLAIRLASELLIGRYQLPSPRDPNSAVARHEAALLTEAKHRLIEFGGVHRSEDFNRNILPLSLPMIQAIGHRMALEAAKDANIDSNLCALYESGVILEDSAWYTEQGGISRRVQREIEAQAADTLLPDLERLVYETGAGPYSSAPMTSEPLWNTFVSELETYSGEALLDIGASPVQANL